jgi:hypothetical protein
MRRRLTVVAAAGALCVSAILVLTPAAEAKSKGVKIPYKCVIVPLGHGLQIELCV